MHPLPCHTLVLALSLPHSLAPSLPLALAAFIRIPVPPCRALAHYSSVMGWTSSADADTDRWHKRHSATQTAKRLGTRIVARRRRSGWGWKP
eukprot:2918112-Rhodomonas_salina.2